VVANGWPTGSLGSSDSWESNAYPKGSSVTASLPALLLVGTRWCGGRLEQRESHVAILQGSARWQAAKCVGRECAGIVATLLWLGSSLPEPISRPRGVSGEQGWRVVVRYLESHPQELHRDFKELAAEALIDAWPCKKRGTTSNNSAISFCVPSLTPHPSGRTT
jgi:hypothetical protein